MLAPVCFYRTTLIISSSEFHKFAEMWHSLALEKNKSKNTVLCCIFCVCARAHVRNTHVIIFKFCFAVKVTGIFVLQVYWIFVDYIA